MNCRRSTEFLTAAQAIAIRAEAHRRGYPSIALAQAFAYELMLRQKDVIGEWVPVSEPGLSEVVAGTSKWLNGLHWSDIDQNMKLRKKISKSMRGRNAVANPASGKTGRTTSGLSHDRGGTGTRGHRATDRTGNRLRILEVAVASEHVWRQVAGHSDRGRRTSRNSESGVPRRGHY